MRDTLAIVFFLALVVSLWGLIRPFGNLRRKQFAGISGALFVAWVVAVPPLSPEAKAELAAKDVAEENSKVLAKVEQALESSISYEPGENPQTLAIVGREEFAKLNELEPGAFYAAAESRDCDRVTSGAVSLNASKKNLPVWFVDCDNGNRFMVTREEAHEALDRFSGSALAGRDRAANCTVRNVGLCNASLAQKEADEAEVVAFCDMTVESALVGDSDMAWGWDYRFGDGDSVVVVRDFKAQNAFGANLKHRYRCIFDAKLQRIVSLVIEGPTGSDRLI